MNEKSEPLVTPGTPSDNPVVNHLLWRGYTPRSVHTVLADGSQVGETTWNHHHSPGLRWADVGLVAVILTFALFILKGVPW